MKRLLISVLIATLFGCGLSQEAVPQGTIATFQGTSGGVQEIHLSDGTLCAVLVGYQKGGITCNWKGN